MQRLIMLSKSPRCIQSAQGKWPYIILSLSNSNAITKPRTPISGTAVRQLRISNYAILFIYRDRSAMKVLYFHQYYSTPCGFGGTRAYEMSRALKSAGHDVHVVCGSSAKHNTGLTGEFFKGRRSGIVDGVKITQIDLNYSNYDNYFQRSKKFSQYALSGIKLALTEEYDLLFATSTPLTAGVPGIAARWLRRKQFVFEIRDLWPELPREMGAIRNPIALAALSALEWVCYRSANGCIGLSPGIVQGIKKRSHKKKPIKMIPNVCDLDLFSNKHTSVNRIQGIESDDFVAIFTGAHGKANGLDAVLDAAVVLKSQKQHHIKLVFIGDGIEKPNLISKKERQGLHNCVFLEPIEKNKLPSYMARANVALLILSNVPAFYYGTSPNKFFDYLAMGLPVVNNYPGWLADMITEHNIGIATDPESPKELAEALIKLSQLQADLARMGSNAREIGKSKFNKQHLASEFVQFLDTIHQS